MRTFYLENLFRESRGLRLLGLQLSEQLVDLLPQGAVVEVRGGWRVRPGVLGAHPRFPGLSQQPLELVEVCSETSVLSHLLQELEVDFGRLRDGQSFNKSVCLTTNLYSRLEDDHRSGDVVDELVQDVEVWPRQLHIRNRLGLQFVEIGLCDLLFDFNGRLEDVGAVRRQANWVVY